jgi:hypothetical protein
MEELLLLNREGFIPGPNESYEAFMKRVSLTKRLYEDGNKFFEKEKPPFKLNDRLKKPDLSWVNPTLLNLFDISACKYPVYFSNEKLNFLQGAATWFLDFEGINVPLLQIRKNLKKGSYLRIYELEDVLAHEVVHFARAGFDEKIFEEFLAYSTSSRFIRKVFGPLFDNFKEICWFFGFLSIFLVSQYISIFFESILFSGLFVFAFLAVFGSTIFYMGRLFFRKKIFNGCLKKLIKILKDKKLAKAVIFRLTDREIKKFFKMKLEDIKDYVKSEKSLRWKVIFEAYFKKVL